MPHHLGVGVRIGNHRFDAEFPQFHDDIRHAAVAQVGDVFLEGNAEDPDSRALDRPFRSDQQLDQPPRDIAAHAVVDAPSGEDDLRIISDCLGPRGQVVRIDADAVAADEARA